MKHMGKAKAFCFFGRNRALDYEREQRLGKIKECMELKDENEKLWDMAVKQRLALEALREGHAKDMAEMVNALKSAAEKLAQVEAERDRYKAALRRAFPGKETA